MEAFTFYLLPFAFLNNIQHKNGFHKKGKPFLILLKDLVYLLNGIPTEKLSVRYLFLSSELLFVSVELIFVNPKP